MPLLGRRQREEDRPACDPGGLAYSLENIANVEFLGDRARELADQEIERARALDTKAAGLLAGALVLISAGAALVARLSDLRGGSGAKTLWVAELGTALTLMLAAGLFAVLAIRPRAFRTAIAYHELLGWVTRRVLDQDPTLVRGEILYASIKSVGHARDQNKTKGRWLGRSFAVFGVGLICTVALAVSVAIHAAATATLTSKATTHHEPGRTTIPGRPGQQHGPGHRRHG